MKIRCSALGRLMTAPRNKTEVLSKTAQSYIQELVLEESLALKKNFQVDTPTRAYNAKTKQLVW
jgi:hypothetical protein